MIYTSTMRDAGTADGTTGGDAGPDELARLRRENRRLAVSLGAFSAFLASRGLLEEAWSYINEVHRLDDGTGA